MSTAVAPTASDRLVAELRHQQTVLKLTDEQFAQRLGTTRPLWSMTRSGRMMPNMSLLSGVASVFPGLRDLVMECLVEYHRRKNQ